VSAQVQIKGLQAVIKFLSLLPSAVREAGDQVCSRAAARVEVEAKRIAPWRTGALCRSILSKKIGEAEYTVGASVHYAGYVEYGTSRMREQPYLRPAVNTVMAGLPHEIQLLLQAKINEIK
jgi:HK97 gp10 family phage protein